MMTYSWLNTPASEVSATARALLGWHIAANGVRIRLTGVEAYSGPGVDPASHAYRGQTRRNAVMFGPAGYLYVYFIYGTHWCLNIVCGPAGEAAAVLLRAGDVVEGIELARRRRPTARNDADLARGPAKLATALGVDGSANGTCVVDGTGPVTLTPPTSPVAAEQISAGPRVGVTAAHDLLWRFWITGDPTVSAYRPHIPRRRRR